MKTSIKLKFSAFLVVLLSLAVGVLSVLIMDGIKVYQKSQYEELLMREAETAKLYVSQSSLTDSQLTPSEYLDVNGQWLAANLEKMFNQPAAIYDYRGNMLGSSIAGYAEVDFRELISVALENKSAYMRIGDMIYYAVPLTSGDEQIGAVLLFYSLEANHEFNSHMLRLFINIGILVLLLSFLLGYTYLHSFTRGIKYLIKTTEDIKSGVYDTPVLERKDELGDLSGSLGFMSKQIESTISNLEEEREKLNVAVEKLTQLERQQKQFIGNITHEFKTPLTSINAYLDLQDMYPGDAALFEDARTNIRVNSEKLLEMVEKVLYLSALEKYDFDINPQKTEITERIQTACSRLKGKAERFGISIKTELKEAYVWADKESLLNIFLNLIDNAIKYSKENGGVVIRNYKSGNKINIEITDSGIGIPNAIKDKIFEPFFMADKERSRQKGGAGLGLSLVKTLIERLGGEISLVSKVGKGSTFLVVLPAMQ